MTMAKQMAPAMAGFAALYAVFLSYNLNLFYVRGASVHDAGWFVWLSTNAFAWPLPNPVNIGGNFLSIHFSPIFFVSTYLASFLGNIPDTVKFCLFYSLWLPMFWLAIYLLLGRLSYLAVWQRFSICFLLTFSGLNLAMVGFPHIESFIPAFTLLGMAILLRSRTTLGTAIGMVVIAFAFLIREDAGLHVFLTMAGLSLCGWSFRMRMEIRVLFLLGAIGLFYGLIAMLGQRLFLSGGSRLCAVYLGAHPFSQIHLFGPDGMLRRLGYWAKRREYILAPLLVLAICGLTGRRRESRLLIGFLIALPWLLLALIAVTGAAGDLWDYYCFPLVFAFVFPLLLADFEEDPDRGAYLIRVQVLMAAVSTAAFILIGVFPFGGDAALHDAAPWTHLMPPSFKEIRNTQADLLLPQTVIYDDGAASLALGELRPNQYRWFEAFDAADLARATAFVRFDAPATPYLHAQSGVLMDLFPKCRLLPRTQLEICVKRG